MTVVKWKQYKLHELLQTDFDGAWGEEARDGSGATVLRSTDMRGGKLSFHNAARREIPSKVIKKKRLLDGDILVNKSSGSAHLVGSSVIFSPPDARDYLCSNFIRCLRPVQTRVHPEFLYFGLQSPQFRLQVFGAQRTTSGLRNLKINEFKSGAIPVPESLSEQRRIVARIKECMERVEEIEECGSEISLEMAALYPSTLNELFGDLAVKCGVCRLYEVADIKGGGSLPKGQSTDPGRRDGVLLIKVGDMNEKGNERIVATSRAYLDRKSAGKKMIPTGAVLFPKRGGAIATNKKRMLGRPALVDPNMMAVIANPEHLLPAYLYYWTQTFKLESISNGGVIPQLNRKDLAPLEIPVPPIDEQKLFVFKMEQVEASWFEMVQTHTQAVAERVALREAILRKAFAGGL